MCVVSNANPYRIVTRLIYYRFVIQCLNEFPKCIEKSVVAATTSSECWELCEYISSLYEEGFRFSGATTTK